MKTAFITGASGHIGANLIRALLKKGWQIKCLVNKDERALKGLNIEKIKTSLFNEEGLAKIMTTCDVVFHAAAVIAVEKVDIDYMKKVNIDGTRIICNAALKSKIKKLIYFSSIHAFQQYPFDQMLDEDRPLVKTPSTPPYDYTKSLAQQEVIKAIEKGLNANILHPTGVIGPYDFKPSRMGQMLVNIINGKMPLLINAGFNWVDVRDVCIAAIDCIEKGIPGKNYILSGQWTSFKTLSSIIENELGRKINYGELPFYFLYLALPFSRLWSLITKKRELINLGSIITLKDQCRSISQKLSKKDLSYDPRPIETTIRDTIQWITINK